MQFEEKKQEMLANHQTFETIIDRIIWHGERVEELQATLPNRKEPQAIELLLHEARLIATRIRERLACLSYETDLSFFTHRFETWIYIWKAINITVHNHNQNPIQALLYILFTLFNFTIGELVETLLTHRLHHQLS